MTFKIVFIDGYRHVHHFPGRLLFLFVVGVEFVLDVTEGTLLAERPGEVAHLIDEFGGREILEGIYFDVLETNRRRLLRLM
jgi:hypothetical protein